jgi:D-alanine-D-alanine ligase-like ATP-grasp enzyme/acylphosphatase
MKYKNDSWLPHIAQAVPNAAKKNQISMYTIALEGWRRGLQLNFYSEAINNKLHIKYSLSNGEKTHHFSGSGGDMITEKAFEVCESKSETYSYLTKASVPIPLGSKFDSDALDEDIIQYANQIKFPLVLKPTNASSGKGVVSNIKNRTQLKEAIHFVRERLGYQEVILEQYVIGEEVRVYVLDNHVLGAGNRRPANVVGDGVNTIQTLIEKKNEQRKQSPHLYFRPIKIDNDLKNIIQQSNYTIDSIPKRGEWVYLRKVSNISKGGEPIDITEKLSAEHMNIAINAANAIPGLPHCGVDMIINSNNDAKVIEINTRPGIGIHLFPIEGSARNIPKKLIDYYFPETKTNDAKDSNLYFDFESIINTLKEMSTVQVEVPPAGLNRLVAIKYIITSDLELKQFHQWLQKHVYAHGLHGFIDEARHAQFEMVLAGEHKNKIEEFKEVWLNNKGFPVIIEREEEWNHPIKLGFELISDAQMLSIVELESKLKEMNNEINKSDKENKRLEQRMKLMKESKAWKMTKPLRMVTDFRRKRKQN